MPNSTTMADQDVALTATRTGNRVRIAGPRSFNCPVDSRANRFNFTLADNTNLDVSFRSLDREDDCSTCPPASGNNSRQIVGVAMNNNQTPKKASFTDNNNNKASDGPLDVSFQWNFTCNDSSVRVESYDPIITNGGETR